MDPILLEATLRESKDSSRHWDHLEREMVTWKAPRTRRRHSWTMGFNIWLGSRLVLLGERLRGTTPLAQPEQLADSSGMH
jgi:hypothetical protein